MIYNFPIHSQEVIDTPENYILFSSEKSFFLRHRGNWDGQMLCSVDGIKWRKWRGSLIAAATSEISGESAFHIALAGIKNTKMGNGYNGFDVLDCHDPVHVRGNIESLLDHKTVAAGQHPPMGAGCFAYLFSDCPGMVYPEVTLPAIELSEFCYQGMFYGREYLPPDLKLPATVLARGCYYDMFANSRIFFAPKLPATTLAKYCYSGMFRDCREMRRLPPLPATQLAEYCYSSMFSGCSSIKISETFQSDIPYSYRIPTSGTAIAANYALDNMFAKTGGTFTGTPNINTTYYTDNNPNDD